MNIKILLDKNSGDAIIGNTSFATKPNYIINTPKNRTEDKYHFYILNTDRISKTMISHPTRFEEEPSQ